MKLHRFVVLALCALQLSVASFADAPSAVPPDARAAFLTLLDRPRVMLKPELIELPAIGGFHKYHLWISSEAGERVPGYLLLPDAAKFHGRRPVIIALHGTGGSKDNGQIVQIVTRAVDAGFIGVAIDGRFHGERVPAGSGEKAYDAAIARAFES